MPIKLAVVATPTAWARRHTAPSGGLHPGLQVLLVDDCPVNHVATTALLAPWGIEPTLACDGAQAVALTDRRRFDIIFMDISMPVLDGMQATWRIRLAEAGDPGRCRTPIVAYTSGPLLGDKALQRRIGFDDALAKPCGVDQMSACLERWCAVRQGLPS